MYCFRKQEGCSDISDDTADVDRDLDMLEIGINKKEMGDIMGGKETYIYC